MGVILGLTGAVCWGVADFAARFASRRVGAYRTLLYMQFFGFLALTIFLKATKGFSHGISPGWQPWALAIAAGILNVAASLSLYHSFETGVLSIVAPVSSSYPALTVALALLSGERIGALRGLGLAVTLLGVVLAATSFAPAANSAGLTAPSTAHVHASKGVIWAIFSALGFGVLFWFLGFYVVPAIGSEVSVWVMRLTAIVCLLILAAPVRQTVGLPSGSVWWLLAAVGLMDTTAFVANNTGLKVGPVSVVSVLASLYGAVTVVLSSIFLHERLEWTQWLGIILIFAGIILVSL